MSNVDERQHAHHLIDNMEPAAIAAAIRLLESCLLHEASLDTEDSVPVETASQNPACDLHSWFLSSRKENASMEDFFLFRDSLPHDGTLESFLEDRPMNQLPAERNLFPAG